MKTKIYWKRLSRIASGLIGKKVRIIASTHDSNLRGAIKIQNGIAIIYISLDSNKSVEALIETLAHELAHCLVLEDEHSERFYKKVEELKQKIKEKYYEERV